MEVHQILTSLCNNDAVGNDVIEIQKCLLEHGYISKIYAKHVDPEVSKHAFNLYKYKGSPQNIMLYHLALGAGDVTEYVKKLPDKKVLIYHNITPPHFFKQYNEELEHLCYQGIEELKYMCNEFLLAIGDSEYNQSCLKQLGYKNTAVLPILKDLKQLNTEFNFGEELKVYANTTINILFVGRVAPNKKFEDIIKVFYYYHTFINPDSKLYLVGKNQFPKYHNQLINLINDLMLNDSVIITGIVSENNLKKYYEIAHIFLCMSEHEGFCVPLIEAMACRIPILAYNSTCIPETLGVSGILINKKQYIDIAELINILIVNDKLRERIILKQLERLRSFDIQLTGLRLIELIKGLENQNNY